MRKDFSTADRVLPTIPREQRIRVAYFLEEQVQPRYICLSSKKLLILSLSHWLLILSLCHIEAKYQQQLLLVCLLHVVQGFKQQALAVSTDPEHKFELALQLGDVQTAQELALEAKVWTLKVPQIAYLANLMLLYVFVMS